MQVYGKPLVYLDNAASAQKPRAVLDRMQQAYTTDYANVHRGLHYLANEATEAYEGAREKVRGFLNAGATARRSSSPGNATEAINLVASTFGRERIKAGDEIVLSVMEHHSNIVPWHFLRERQGAVLKWAPVDDDGNSSIDAFEKLLTAAHQDGRGHPHVERARHGHSGRRRSSRIAHARGIPVLVDGAQGAVHRDVDVQRLDCDFYAFTGHKLYGPTGIGALYGKAEHLAAMPPFKGGGEMIREVFEDASPTPTRRTGSRPARRRSSRRSGSARRSTTSHSIGRRAIRAHESGAARAMRTSGCARSIRCAIIGTAHGQGRDRLLQDEGRARARRRHDPRPLRRRGARRHPLRDAAAGALRRDLELPRLVRPIQHARGGRLPCAALVESPGFLHLTDSSA